jgi:hypothetical protein
MEVALFDFSDELFPSGETPVLLEAADAICWELEDREPITGFARVIAEQRDGSQSDNSNA